MMSVAELKDALKSQKARKLMHLPPEIWSFQLYAMGRQEKTPTKRAARP